MLQEYYNNKILFLTGCTGKKRNVNLGFVGKVLLEKTLRCLPNIRCIFVLIR